MLNLTNINNFKIFLKIILFCIYFFGFLSCQISLSSQVKVSMLGAPTSPIPIVFYKGNENAICRKGLPDDYRLPWSFEDDTASGDSEEREDEIQINVDDFWFRFYPVIDNETPFYLVVTELRIKVFHGLEQVAQEEFTDGWCNTTPLYFLEPKGGGEHKSYTLPHHINTSFAKGNLWFYVGGLPQEQQDDSLSRSFQEIKIGEYNVEWQMLGYFALENGRITNEKGVQIGGFQKRGSFTVLPSSF